jgi:hypothetical protein
MSSLRLRAMTLPGTFRDESKMPRTPEPASTDGDDELLSYPRPRLRLRKRNASSQLRAASHHQFVTDATAVTTPVTADTPIPSIEALDSAAAFTTSDENMIDYLPTIHLQHGDDDGKSLMNFCPIGMGAVAAPSGSRPQTPTVDLAPSYKAFAKFPNWSIESSWSDSDLESSPEYESSRPSTAFSTQTSSSLFSHFSHPSEDGDCISPDVDKGYFNFADWHGTDNTSLNSSRAPRKAPWTRAMSSHLWSTYMLYLSDSTVTPVNMGKSCIPPNGVCARVAREAKRSWKGSKQMLDSNKSGSSTPTAESARPYIEWPHTGAATRAHLRELCKLRAAPAVAPNMAQSPAPFSKAAHRRWNRRSTPLRSPSVFSAQEMGMSLAMSTSETMHPEGPLARLTRSVRGSQDTPQQTLPQTRGPKSEDQVENDPFVDHGSQASRMRLGSPFAKSYGPSSSSTLAEGIESRRQSQTVGPRNFLKSPARLTKSGTQKRRSNKNCGKPRKRRPSLASVVWDPPTNSSQNTLTDTQFSSTDSCENDKLFIPRSSTTGAFSQSATGLHEPSMQMMPASMPARLGSPFSFPNASHSFPNRFTQPIHFNLGALRKPFATVHQTREPSSETSPTRAGLSSRLAYLDQRLKDLRNRTSRQKSQSPSV